MFAISHSYFNLTDNFWRWYIICLNPDSFVLNSYET